ncbi:MAG: PIN domain-containing protein [Planctomycetes bacterium]|nr:PIN domain-containing protein [Planctomycetota bacterium]
MPDYLLDTNIVAYWYDSRRPEHAKVLDHIEAVRQPDPQTPYVPRLFVSVVTIGEIEYGHRVVAMPNVSKQSEYLSKQSEYLKFVGEQCLEPLVITRHVGERYGNLRAWLFKEFSDKKKRARWPEELADPTTAKSLGVQENDIWIAAQAITHNFVLVTHDSRGHFGELQRHFAETLRVEDKLRVEDWAK